MIAIEPSAALWAIARGAARGANFRHGSVYEMALPSCDAILAVGEPLNYHAVEADADARVQRLLLDAQQVLPAGGLFIFDLVTTGEVSLDSRG